MSKGNILYTKIKQTSRNTAMPRIWMDVMSTSSLRLRSCIWVGGKSFVSPPAVCSNPVGNEQPIIAALMPHPRVVDNIPQCK